MVMCLIALRHDPIKICQQMIIYIIVYCCKLHEQNYIVRKPVSIWCDHCCLTQCNTSPSHRVDQVVDCGLWNVVPLLFRKWNTQLYTPIQSIPNMLNGTCPVSMLAMQELGCFSFQELCTDPCTWGRALSCFNMR